MPQPFNATRGARLKRVQAAQETDVRIWRDEDGTVHANVPHSVVWHSPSGFEVGYGGSGPADLALNVLNAFVPPGRSPSIDADGVEHDDSPVKCYAGQCSAFAARHHQAFKVQFIATMHRDGGTLPARTIREWIDARRRVHEGVRA